MASLEFMDIGKHYSDEYFDRVRDGALRSAHAVVPILLEYVHPSKVIDVGCGTGAWLQAFIERGITQVIGVDGPWVDPELLPFSRNRFVASDLTQPLELHERFDLVMSLEVAEHLPPESALRFVNSLTDLGSIILFSAAVPGQGGTDHLNEQWPDYWARLFLEHGYRAIDCLRPRLWGVSEIDWWYQQNLILYVEEASLAENERLNEAAAASSVLPKPLVHPKLEEWINWSTTRDRLAEGLNGVLPQQAQVVVADVESLGIELEGQRVVRPFHERDGVPLGSPADDATAIKAFEQALKNGAEFVVIPWSVEWWFDAYPNLMQRLAAFGEFAHVDGARIFDCRRSLPDGTTG